MQNDPIISQGSVEVVKEKRRGAIVPLLAICLIPLLGMMAFSIDYGFLRVVKSDLQRAADAACLAAVIDLVPDPYGVQDLGQVKATLREYVQYNMATAADGSPSFVVLDSDIQIGRYDENTIYDPGSVTIRSDGKFDTVRVTLRRDASANDPVPLFFAQILGINDQPVVATATAVLRRGNAFKAGSDILPFALPEEFWDSLADGDELSIFNDNKIEDEYGNEVVVLDAQGNPVPGNWGTVDIGPENNSTSALGEQIRNGLTQSDLDALVADGRLANNDELRAPLFLQADPGLSAGIKDDVRSIHGQTRIIPIYESVNSTLFSSSGGGKKGGGGGNNAEFHTVKWGVVKVLDSRWNGNKNTYVLSQKAYTYDGGIVPNDDLRDKTTVVDGGFAAAALVR